MFAHNQVNHKIDTIKQAESVDRLKAALGPADPELAPWAAPAGLQESWTFKGSSGASKMVVRLGLGEKKLYAEFDYASATGKHSEQLAIDPDYGLRGFEHYSWRLTALATGVGYLVGGALPWLGCRLFVLLSGLLRRNSRRGPTKQQVE